VTIQPIDFRIASLLFGCCLLAVFTGWDIRAQTHFIDYPDGIRGYLYQSSKFEAISKKSTLIPTSPACLMQFSQRMCKNSDVIAVAKLQFHAELTIFAPAILIRDGEARPNHHEALKCHLAAFMTK